MRMRCTAHGNQLTQMVMGQSCSNTMVAVTPSNLRNNEWSNVLSKLQCNVKWERDVLHMGINWHRRRTTDHGRHTLNLSYYLTDEFTEYMNSYVQKVNEFIILYLFIGEYSLPYNTRQKEPKKQFSESKYRTVEGGLVRARPRCTIPTWPSEKNRARQSTTNHNSVGA